MLTKDNKNTNKQCYFCVNNLKDVDYKDIEVLKEYIDGHSRIVKHRKTANCSLHQRKMTAAIKRARFLALLPFITG